MEYRKLNNVLSRDTSYAEFKEVYDEVRGASTKKQIANYCFAKEVTGEETSGTSLLSLRLCSELADGQKALLFIGFTLYMDDELKAIPSGVIVGLNEEDESVDFVYLPYEE